MAKEKVGNIVVAKVSIVGTRPLMQHQFGPDAIPLEKGERTGVAGNDPQEWLKTRMVTPDGQLYIRGDYVFGCLCGGAKYTKKGRGSIQPLLAATLQVEEPVILLDRWLPKEGEPKHNTYGEPVYIDVRGVKNPSTKARNVRYRLSCSKGWRCAFTITWDRKIVGRELMPGVLRDAGSLVGLADGRSAGCGRFAVEKYEEDIRAEEAPAA